MSCDRLYQAAVTPALISKFSIPSDPTVPDLRADMMITSWCHDHGHVRLCSYMRDIYESCDAELVEFALKNMVPPQHHKAAVDMLFVFLFLHHGLPRAQPVLDVMMEYGLDWPAGTVFALRCYEVPVTSKRLALRSFEVYFREWPEVKTQEAVDAVAKWFS
jgi:hypothetical protein